MNQELTHIYTVSGLTREIRDRLETHFSLVWVSGEVSNLRQPLSGHYYFTLKDAQAQLRGVLFKGNHQHLRFKPQEGSQILCRGRLTVYELRGEYQLVVDYLEPLGLGALAQAFEALKTLLAAEGLFDAALKKPLPFLPRKIALITSPTGAAVRDFLRLVRRRCPSLEILIYPVKVQGVEAAGEISRALDDLAAYPGVEVIVLTRGGGSLEDLWPFNEETVARAIHRCRVPVVAAVGHEVDVTIADFVADVRAPTPSAAAELVAPDQAELLRRLDRRAAALVRTLTRRLESGRRYAGLLARGLPDMRRQVVNRRLQVDEEAEILQRRLRRYLNDRRQQVRLNSSRLMLLSPRRFLVATRGHLEQLEQRLFSGWQRCQQTRRRHLEYCRSHLDKLNPLAILARGYAVATRLPEETVIRDASLVPLGAPVRVRVARGRLDCEVQEVGSEQ